MNFKKLKELYHIFSTFSSVKIKQKEKIAVEIDGYLVLTDFYCCSLSESES